MIHESYINSHEAVAENHIEKKIIKIERRQAYLTETGRTLPSSQFRKMKNIDSGHITKRSGRDHGDHRLYMESKVMSAEILILAYSKLEGDAMVST